MRPLRMRQVRRSFCYYCGYVTSVQNIIVLTYVYICTLLTVTVYNNYTLNNIAMKDRSKKLSGFKIVVHDCIYKSSTYLGALLE